MVSKLSTDLSDMVVFVDIDSCGRSSDGK